MVVYILKRCGKWQRLESVARNDVSRFIEMA
nr:MAG TPA: hypothetical protein [Caudoviricetes sp.]DAN55679.1 MAG TPA: hypothetical protein [Caudoviricetes sp.]DAU85007.1 MAG TPA: hypothetical protein [Caudoviricetes sp.]